MEDLEISLDFAKSDESFIASAEELIDSLEVELSKLKIITLFGDFHDDSTAIVTIHAGAGGTEAQDWVSMLLRMYKMYAEKNDFGFTIVDWLDGEVAGYKSVTFRFTGNYAYGYIKNEMGVHRLVRISPFDSGGRRHTSFASVEVIPQIESNHDINIDSDDLRIDTYRSSGAGGQHVNKTDSAVRITHLPTNIVVTCQNERSQIQNREQAMNMLRSKLLVMKEQQEIEDLNTIKGEQKKIEWGSQIRSYVFCPYTLVKDHRTNYEKTDIGAVMDGGIEEFVDQNLMRINAKNGG